MKTVYLLRSHGPLGWAAHSDQAWPISQTGDDQAIRRHQRLYDPAAGRYVTLEDLADMVEDDEDFVVTDAETGEDITRSVLKQIIVERKRHG